MSGPADSQPGSRLLLARPLAGAGPDGSRRHLLALNDRRSYVSISASSYELLRLRGLGRTFEEIAASVRASDGKTYSAAEIESAHRVLEERIRAAERRIEPRGVVGLIRVQLLPPALVGRIASGLAWLFHPWVAGALLAGAAALHGSFLTRTTGLGAPLSTVGQAYALVVASLLVHELGHASACARFGSKPSQIGLTNYLFLPAFYSDVNAAWELGRLQRVVVDLGGVYFQLLFSSGLVLAYSAGGWPSCRLAIGLVLVSIAFSLNPMFRLDGYWVLADAVGVPNLGRRALRSVGSIRWPFLRRPRREPPPAPTSLFLMAYAAVTVGMWGILATKLWFELRRSLLGAYRSVSSAFSGGTFPFQVSLVPGGVVLLFAVAVLGVLLPRLWRAAAGGRMAGPSTRTQASDPPLPLPPE